MHGKTITREGFRNRSLQVPKSRVLTHLGLSLKYTWTIDSELLVRYSFNETREKQQRPRLDSSRVRKTDRSALVWQIDRADSVLVNRKRRRSGSERSGGSET